MHVSNGIKVSKWWQSFYSWVNFCFKHIVMQFQPKHILNMTNRLLCDTCRNTHIQTSQKALISCRRHALHNARDPKEHKPHTKMVKQTRALTQTLTLRKLLGHFMSTLPRLHAYDTPCRDMFPEVSRMNASIHMHTKTQAKQRVNTTPLSLSVCLWQLLKCWRLLVWFFFHWAFSSIWIRHWFL